MTCPHLAPEAPAPGRLTVGRCDHLGPGDSPHVAIIGGTVREMCGPCAESLDRPPPSHVIVTGDGRTFRLCGECAATFDQWAAPPEMEAPPESVDVGPLPA